MGLSSRVSSRTYREAWAMGKYYCDYCDTYLTHDSRSVRKTHLTGRKHKDCVREYYQAWLEREAAKLIAKTQQLPTIIADNGGYDSHELISQLRAKHTQGEHSMGLDMENGSIGCVQTMGITESYMVKRRVVGSAASAAEMILRVDNILSAAPRQRGGDQCM